MPRQQSTRLSQHLYSLHCIIIYPTKYKILWDKLLVKSAITSKESIITIEGYGNLY